MAKEKTNIEHLRDIQKELIKKASEFEELIDATEKQIEQRDERIKNIEDEEKDDDDDTDAFKHSNSDFVGLDTIHWTLDSGNLVIQQQVEDFILSLKKQNAVSIV